jgi:hypothetical protein
MNYTQFETYFSPPRLNPYLTACGGDQDKTKNLYKLNIKLSKSFFSLLSVLEVVLRNTLNQKLSFHFRDSEWITNQKTGFMINGSLAYNKFYLKKEVEKAESKVKTQYTVVTANRVIAEQTLGFWVSLFEKNHYKLLKGVPIQIFLQKPSGVKREHINSMLKEIRSFRNRISHNEPICFDSTSNIDATKAENVSQWIGEILDWIDTDICLEMSSISDIDDIILELKAMI